MAKLEKKRSEINNEDKWNVDILYPSIEDWNKDYEEIKKIIPSIEDYKNNLLDSPENLYKALNTYHLIYRKIEKLYMYAHLNYDTDTSNTKIETILRKVENCLQDFSIKSSYIEPTLLSVEYKFIEDYINRYPSLNEYKNGLKEIFRYENHKLTLNEKELSSKF